MELITVNNLTFKYPKSETAAVDNVSLAIQKGSYTAIVGFNGSGKSTLARIICGLELPESGSVAFNENVRLGIVFQSPKNQIVSSIVNRDTSFGPQNQKLPSAEIELRTIECLNVVDLLDHAQSGTAELSLGQVQKTALAGMLACNPDVLILDEALSMIDPQTRQEVFEFLRYWHSKGKTILHITHDLDALKDTTDVIGIENGKVFYYGSTDAFLKEKKHTQMIEGKKLTSVNKKALLKKNDKQVSFRASDLSFSYNGKYGIKNVSFELYKGTVTALTGASGAGKSTILELCAGLNSNYTGKIICKNHPALAQQNAASALFEAFAADDVAFGPGNKGVKGKDLVQLVKDSMETAGLDYQQFKNRHTFELSGGEQRRLSIAGIIALDSDVVLFDEPTAGLDAEAKYKVMSMLRQLAQKGKTVLFSTHHQDEIDFADREIQIENGCLVKDTCGLSEKGFVESGDDVNNMVEQQAFSAAGLIAGLRSATSGFGSSAAVKKSILLKVPAWFRILLFLVLFIASLCPVNFIADAVMLGVCIAYALIGSVRLKSLLSSFIKILPFLLFFAVLQLMFKAPLPDEVRFTTWKFLTITPSKLWFCGATILRTYSAICCICGFFVSTPEYDLIDGLKILLWPLEAVKIPVRYLILIIEIMFRFVPLLIEETGSIIKTQIIRGSMGTVKGVWEKIKALIPLFVPIIIQTIKRSEALADAITMRGF